jgi:hypothetical protein
VTTVHMLSDKFENGSGTVTSIVKEMKSGVVSTKRRRECEGCSALHIKQSERAEGVVRVSVHVKQEILLREKTFGCCHVLLVLATQANLGQMLYGQRKYLKLIYQVLYHYIYMHFLLHLILYKNCG